MLTSEQRLSAIHRLGRALSDPTRCRLLLALLDGPGYPADLADHLGLTRQNVSNHLACLRDCGLVRTQAHGRRVAYELVDASLSHALEDLLRVVWGTGRPHATVEGGAEDGSERRVG
ncbi:Cd(II)/Pb(II)-sensing metalloregulatory transcriptional regulator CmtR [Nocardiopsis lambiniae]|uniref:Metalloregulator ArsR/SmtB family transcription factor n=1 Tax=Nocardiopsis lambiniae TaxID=3075539 RepID=A0ABU2M4R0_9ACTN|nr:metalloregulator ArsR/SmtB family transcription factor [Nocardiopsis sp. DSM 44743]MDT0327610.1 metalloregulator ArsR/SmtB family transcription factor [Nocardiopsis sp. DSM 44743]